jgi:hypothetical protein
MDLLIARPALRHVGEAAPRVDSEADQLQLRRRDARSSAACCCFSSCCCTMIFLLFAILFFFTAFILAAIAPAVPWVHMSCNCPSSTSSYLYASYALDGSSMYSYFGPDCGSSLTPASLLASQLPTSVDIAAAGREQFSLTAASAVLLFGCFSVVCFALLPFLCGCTRRVCCNAEMRDYEPFEDPRVISTLYRATIAMFPAALLATTLLSIGASTFQVRVMSFLGTISGSSLNCYFSSAGSSLEIAGAILAPISLLPLAFALCLSSSWLFVRAVPEKGAGNASASTMPATLPAASAPSPQAFAVVAGASIGNAQLQLHELPANSGDNFASSPAGDFAGRQAIAYASTCAPAPHASNPDVLTMLHLVGDQHQLVAQQVQQTADFHVHQAQQRQRAQQTQQWHPQQPQQPWGPPATFVDFRRPLAIDPHGNLFDVNGRFVGRAPEHGHERECAAAAASPDLLGSIGGDLTFERISARGGAPPSDQGVGGGDATPLGHTDLFISYAWGPLDEATNKRPLQEHVLAIVNQLRDAGFTVWLDLEQMPRGATGGASGTPEAMVQGILHASAVICFFSTEYAHSPNCKLEAQFAKKKDKPLFFVNVGTPGYKADKYSESESAAVSWLDVLMMNTLWFDARDEQRTAPQIAELISALKGNANVSRSVR